MRYTVLAMLLVTSCAWGQLITMDAAQLDKLGQPLDTGHVRLIADNTLGAKDLTGVYFHVESHGEPIDSGQMLAWDSDLNPWKGAPGAASEFVRDNILYDLGVVYYGDTPGNIAAGIANCFGPRWVCFYLEGHPNYTPMDPAFEPQEPESVRIEMWNWMYNNFEIEAAIPAGIKLDFAVKLHGATTGFVDLFSVAEGQLQTDDGVTPLSDADPMPQTVPEPGTLAVLVAGAAVGVLRKK